MHSDLSHTDMTMVTFQGPDRREDAVVLWVTKTPIWLPRHLFLISQAANFWFHLKRWRWSNINITKKSLACCICCCSLFLCTGSRIRVWWTFSLWGLTLSTSCCCLAEDFFIFSCSSSSFMVRCCSFSKLASGFSNLSPIGRWLDLNISMGPKQYSVPSYHRLSQSEQLPSTANPQVSL